MCYVINEKDEPCTFPIGNTLSRIDIRNYLGGQMYPAVRLAFCPNKYKPPISNDEMNSKNAELEIFIQKRLLRFMAVHCNVPIKQLMQR